MPSAGMCRLQPCRLLPCSNHAPHTCSQDVDCATSATIAIKWCVAAACLQPQLLAVLPQLLQQSGALVCPLLPYLLDTGLRPCLQQHATYTQATQVMVMFTA